MIEIKKVNGWWYVLVDGKPHAGFTTKRVAERCADRLRKGE